MPNPAPAHRARGRNGAFVRFLLNGWVGPDPGQWDRRLRVARSHSRVRRASEGVCARLCVSDVSASAARGFLPWWRVRRASFPPRRLLRHSFLSSAVPEKARQLLGRGGGRDGRSVGAAVRAAVAPQGQPRDPQGQVDRRGGRQGASPSPAAARQPKTNPTRNGCQAYLTIVHNLSSSSPPLPSYLPFSLVSPPAPLLFCHPRDYPSRSPPTCHSLSCSAPHSPPACHSHYSCTPLPALLLRVLTTSPTCLPPALLLLTTI